MAASGMAKASSCRVLVKPPGRGATWKREGGWLTKAHPGLLCSNSEYCVADRFFDEMAFQDDFFHQPIP
jgi:hypothetical protein